MYTGVLLHPRLKWRDIHRLRASLRPSKRREFLAGLRILWLYWKSKYLIRRASFAELRRRYRELEEKEAAGLLNPGDERLLLRAAHELGEFGPEHRRLQELYFDLLALGFYISGSSSREIAEELGSPEWLTLHEVLARTAWMAEHRRLLSKGYPIKRAFRCAVGSRGTAVRRVDREFYQLIHFLHGLKACLGRELLFKEKRETPDFVVEDTDGARFGVEMTEVPQSQHWADEMDARDQVCQAVKSVMGRARLSVTINDPPSWQAAAGALNADRCLTEGLRSEIRGIHQRTELTIPETGLQLRCQPARIQILFTADDRGETSADDIAANNEMSQTMKAAIEMKIVKNGKRRKRPAVQPCYLVLYPNSGSFPLDLSEVTKEVRASLAVDTSSHFCEVWLSSEERIERVV